MLSSTVLLAVFCRCPWHLLPMPRNGTCRGVVWPDDRSALPVVRRRREITDNCRRRPTDTVAQLLQLMRWTITSSYVQSNATLERTDRMTAE